MNAAANPKTLTWQLSLSSGLSSSAIAWFGGGGYSHIDVVTTDGWLRGARHDRIGNKPSGYFDRPPDYGNDVWIRRTLFALEITAAQYVAYWSFSRQQLGKPYDDRGIWGFALGKRDWREDDSWFCSEEVAANLEYAQLINPLFEGTNRVDPGDCAFIFCALGASIYEMTPGEKLNESLQRIKNSGIKPGLQ